MKSSPLIHYRQTVPAGYPFRVDRDQFQVPGRKFITEALAGRGRGGVKRSLNPEEVYLKLGDLFSLFSVL
jgi:hypothetical protein